MEMFWQVLSLARDKDLSAMAIDAELEIDCKQSAD
jgi:hypothetical protein